MNELINMVAQRTGLSQEQAQKAVAAVVEFMRTRLPAPLAAQLDSFLVGGGNLSGLGQRAGDMIKGVFSGNK